MPLVSPLPYPSVMLDRSNNHFILVLRKGGLPGIEELTKLRYLEIRSSSISITCHPLTGDALYHSGPSDRFRFLPDLLTSISSANKLEVILLTFCFARKTGMEKEIAFWRAIDERLSNKCSFPSLPVVAIRLRLLDFETILEFTQVVTLNLLFPKLHMARRFVVIREDVINFQGNKM